MICLSELLGPAKGALRDKSWEQTIFKISVSTIQWHLLTLRPDSKKFVKHDEGLLLTSVGVTLASAVQL